MTVAQASLTLPALGEDPRLDLALALADDELIIGHRHSQWTGVAPHLEEDLAFSSIAQDEVGHAVLWYGLAAGRVPGADDDSLGLGRLADGYRHAILVERPNRDWGYTLARHYLYDVADDVRLTALAESSWREAAELTGALRREERYHLQHAREWLRRLARGPVDARRKLEEGMVAALGEALGLFEPLPGEDALLADGTLPVASSVLLERWLGVIAGELSDLGLHRILDLGSALPDGEVVATASGEMSPAQTLVGPHLERVEGRWAPVGAFTGRGGRHGRHSDDWPEAWEEMTATYRAHPGASW